MHWTERYLTLGYARGGDGPDAYDCWSFFRLVQRERYGRDVAFMPSPKGLRNIAAEMPARAARLGWERVESPADGDAVFMRFWLHPTHVGVYVGDLARVLHCAEGGAVAHPVAHLGPAGWEICSYWRAVGGMA